MISFQSGVLGRKKERRPELDTESAAVKHPPRISQVVENRPIPDTPDFHLSISLALGPIASRNGWGRESSTDSNTARPLDGVAASSGRQSFLSCTAPSVAANRSYLQRLQSQKPVSRIKVPKKAVGEVGFWNSFNASPTPTR